MMEIRHFTSKAALDEAHREDIARFPIVFAFSRQDLIEGAKRVWGKDMESGQSLPKIVSLGAGGYILKKDKDAYIEMCKAHREEQQLFGKSFKELVSAIKSSMINREYSYTLDKEDVMEELYAFKDLPRFDEAWKKAEKAVLKGTA